MDESEVTNIVNELLLTGLYLVGPAVLTSLLVGLLISIFQTVTSIQEQTLSFAPRILAVGIALALTMSWTLQVAMDFTTKLMTYTLEMSH